MVEKSAIEMALELAYLDGYNDSFNRREPSVSTKELFAAIEKILVKRGLAESGVEVMDKIEKERGEHDKVILDLLETLTDWFVILNKLVEQGGVPAPVVKELKPPSLDKERLLPKKKEDPVKHSDLPPEKTPEATFETPKTKMERFECVVSGCGGKFETESDLMRHMGIVHNVFKSEVHQMLAKEGIEKKSKETPVKPTGKAKLVLCDLCKQEMTTTNYKKHIARCKKTCPHCKQVFKKAKLGKHLASCKGYGPRVEPTPEPAPPKEEKPADPPAAPPKPDENHKRPVPEFKGPRQCLACKLSIPNDSAHPYCDKCWAIAKRARAEHPRDKPWSESKFG